MTPDDELFEFDFADDQAPPDFDRVLSGPPPGPEQVEQVRADAQAAMARWADDELPVGEWQEDENGYSQEFHDWATKSMEGYRARRRAAVITPPCDLNMEDDWARNIARLPAGMELKRGDRVEAGYPGFHSPAIVQEVEEVDGHWFVYVRQVHLLQPEDHHG